MSADSPKQIAQLGIVVDQALDGLLLRMIAGKAYVAPLIRLQHNSLVQVDPARASGIWINDYRYANAGPYGWSAVKLQ